MSCPALTAVLRWPDPGGVGVARHSFTCTAESQPKVLKLSPGGHQSGATAGASFSTSRLCVNQGTQELIVCTNSSIHPPFRCCIAPGLLIRSLALPAPTAQPPVRGASLTHLLPQGVTVHRVTHVLVHAHHTIVVLRPEAGERSHEGTGVSTQLIAGTHDSSAPTNCVSKDGYQVLLMCAEPCPTHPPTHPPTHHDTDTPTAGP
jgi:hypothetical protein